MASIKETRRKNLRKNLSFDPTDYKYIKKVATKQGEKMAPMVLRAVALLDRGWSV